MKTQGGEENSACNLQRGAGGKLKEELPLTELYKLSLEICQGPSAPLQSHKRKPIRNPGHLNMHASVQLLLPNALEGHF